MAIRSCPAGVLTRSVRTGSSRSLLLVLLLLMCGVSHHFTASAAGVTSLVTRLNNLQHTVYTCTADDTTARRRQKRYTFKGGRWRERRLIYHIQRYPPYLNHQGVDDIFRKAFEMWSKPTLLSFRFCRYNCQNAHIKIIFAVGDHGDKQPMDGQGHANKGNKLGHAFGPNMGVFKGQIHLDAGEPWTLETRSHKGFLNQDSQKTYMLPVVVHEIGHALGLSHSDIEDAVMFAVLNIPDVFQLHPDDITGIQKLYGVRPGFLMPPLPTLQTVPDLCREPAFDAITDWQKGSILVFKRGYYWRLNRFRLGFDPGFPRHVHTDFPEVPIKVDTILYCPNGKYEALYFFKGGQVFVHYPDLGRRYNRITDIDREFPGLGRQPIDAAFTGEDGHISFIRGNRHWLYSRRYAVEQQPITGIPGHVDGMFMFTNQTNRDVKKYFIFSKNSVFELDSSFRKVKSAGEFRWSWLHCVSSDSTAICLSRTLLLLTTGLLVTCLRLRT